MSYDREEGLYEDEEEDFGAWSKDKCAAFREDFLDFLNYVSINSKDSGQIVLGENLFQAQLMMLDGILDALSRGIHDIKILKSRQLGISTFSRAFTLFWNGMHHGLHGYVALDTGPHKEEARLELLTMIKNLPAHLGFPRIKRENRDLLELTNESVLNFASAGVRSSKSSGTLGRGSGISFAHNSEMCSWESTEGVESYKNSFSDINPNRLYIWESTARGFNLWHEMWGEAADDPTHQKTIFLGWWSKDSQKISQRHPDFEKYGRPPQSDNEKKKIAAVKEKYGWDITPEQLAWIRRKMDPTAKGEGDAEPDFEGDVLRIQEQPWCVTRETRVGTARGILRIDEIIEGDVCTLGRALKAGPTGVAPIWRAKTKLGYELRGTGNHPIIDTEGNEVRLDASLGATVKLQAPRFADELAIVKWRDGVVDCAVTITPDFARLVGLFMGDGSVRGGGPRNVAAEFKITCDAQDDDTIAECVRLIDANFGIQAHTRRIKGWVDVRVGSQLIVNTFRRLGMTRHDTGSSLRRVHVPEFIWRSPKHVVAEFLKGLFEADGFIDAKNCRVAFFSKYPRFISDIQILLLGFGITCRSVSMLKKSSHDYVYTGHQIEMRKAETDKFSAQIGFISARKRARSTVVKLGRWGKPKIAPARPLQDEIISVECEGGTETVYNLTIEGEHLFDANGILTHNTEEEAFQVTGATFFEPLDLTNIANKHVSARFQTYSFTPGLEFTACRVHKAHNARSVQLKIWEEPDPDGVYVLAADPAFGSNENNDRSAIQVLRCYADCVEQVAEYAWPLINTRQFAWVIAALLGHYQECYFILELNGPGNAVLQEFMSLRHQLERGYQRAEAQEKGLANILGNVKQYLYTRVDSMSAGRNLHFKTTGPLKVLVMERLRDFVGNNKVILRSMDTVEEMKAITREGDSIEAAGSKKDDRVMALALGIHIWEQRVRKGMSSMNRTREFEVSKKRMTITDQAAMFQQNQISAFFAGKANLRKRAAISANRDAWRKGVRR